MSSRLFYANIDNNDALIDGGFERNQSETLLRVLSDQKHDNIYSKDEVNDMIAENIQKVFDKFDENQRRSEDRFEDKFAEQRKEFRSDRKWIVNSVFATGGVIVAAIGLAVTIIYHLHK